MYTFSSQQLIAGGVEEVWSTWTDMNSYPDWDPREERTVLSGPFAVGTTVDSKQRGNPGGTATIVNVQAPTAWTIDSPLPGGRLVISHTISAGPEGHVLVAKRYTAGGPLVLLFRLWFGPRVVRALPATFTALESEVARRRRIRSATDPAASRG